MSHGPHIACAYFDDTGNCVETLIEHTCTTYYVWEMCMKKYYEEAIRRVFGRYSKLAVDLALLTHDAGKLAEAYGIPRLRRFYRHEVVSAYLAYSLLKHPALSSVDLGVNVSLAILLHHEPIILGAYAGELGERYIKVSTVKAMLERVAPDGRLKLINDLSYVNLVNHKLGLSGRGSPLLQALQSAVSISSVIDAIKEVIASASLGDISTRLIRRLRVGTLLHVLVLADSLAASMRRHGQSTWVVRRAVSSAEPRGLVKCLSSGELQRCVQTCSSFFNFRALAIT